MSIKKYWKEKAKLSGDFIECPRVVCADGFSMSVQASRFHYCTPRVSDMSCPYTTWEIGFPSKREELILSYAENKRAPKQTVYGGVPTVVINRVIRKHGGIRA